MAILRFYGRGALARFLGVSEVRISQINPAPDAFVDGRPVWLPATAARLKAEREARRAERSKKPGAAAVSPDHPAAA
jgi:hypothetical protein